MWYAIWVVLILATLAGAFFLGRDLVRKVRRLARKAGRASDLLADAAERISVTSEQLAAAAPPTAPTILGDPAELRARVLTLRTERADRRAATRVRHRATWDRWRAFNG
jgi:hypothetical protein